MKSAVINVSGKECYLYIQPEAKYLLIQPVDEHDLNLLDNEVELVHRLSDKPFTLAAFKVNDWNSELTPWSAPPVFGKIPFGDGAEETLDYITVQMLPMLREKGIDMPHCLLGGYSLAGQHKAQKNFFNVSSTHYSNNSKFYLYLCSSI